jgi:excisionase family DNA binding protein
MSSTASSSPHQLYEATQGDATVEYLSPEVVHGDMDAARLIGPNGERLNLSPRLYDVLARVIGRLQEGRAVQIVTYGRELTTQQAADILNISRQYLIKLLDRGDIPFTKAGTHRRLRLDDVLAYRRRRNEQRRAAIERLARASQEMGDY